MKNIILKHFNMYPKMQIIDFVKLIYQNEFGGGHLIKDSSVSLNYLKQEYNSVIQSENTSFYEDIGNGIVRVNLSSLNKNNLSLERLNELFVLSANSHKGDLKAFVNKLNMLEQMIKDKELPLNYKEYQDFINKYKELGYPMVSHSKQYKEYYCPAYRIILLKYLKGDSNGTIWF